MKIKDLQEKAKLLNLEIITNLDKLENIQVLEKILVKDKYGILEVPVRSIMLERKLYILSAINKTHYFINKSKEIHRK